MKVAWDTSHGEFGIEDYYYFSKLKRLAENEGIKMTAVNKFSKLAEYDIIVINYPEIPFRKSEIRQIKSWLKKGKCVILAAYYSNMDGVAEIINEILSDLSDIRVNYDVVKDEKNNYGGDEMFPLARFGELNVVMPCSASIDGGEPILAAKKTLGARDDHIICLGTCVFWDNYSIDLADNKQFSLKLLSGEV